MVFYNLSMIFINDIYSDSEFRLKTKFEKEMEEQYEDMMELEMNLIREGWYEE